MSDLPTFSVVTPSLDQGQFLGRAIESVLAQDIDGLDYLVMDGVSSDNSIEILKSYGARIRWVSEPDLGQSHAINKGFRRTEGEILAWINADDELPPGALARVRDLFARHPEVDLIYGQGRILDETGRETGPFTGIEPHCLWRLTHFLDYVLQPAAFFRRSAFEALGGLDESLCYTMDWDLWIRLAGRGGVLFADEVLGFSREYGATKTSTGGLRRILEISRLAKRHTGRRWTPGVKMYLLDTLQRSTFAGLPKTLRAALDPMLLRSMHATVLGVGVFADGWLGPRSAISVPAHWPAFEAEVEIPHRIADGDGDGDGDNRVEIRIQVPGLRPQVETAIVGDRHVIRSNLSSSPEAASKPLLFVRIAVDFSIRPPGDGRELALRLLRLESVPETAISEV